MKHIAVSSGINEPDLVRLKEIIDAIPELEYICLDVANGYTEAFTEVVRQTRAQFPTKTIIVSKNK